MKCMDERTTPDLRGRGKHSLKYHRQATHDEYKMSEWPPSHLTQNIRLLTKELCKSQSRGGGRSAFRFSNGQSRYAGITTGNNNINEGDRVKKSNRR